MKTANVSGDSIGIIILITILTLGGFLIYRKYFSSSTDTPSVQTSTSGAGAGTTTTISTPTITQLNATSRYVAANPHMRGKWRNKQNNTIFEPYLNKTFLKDKDVEILGANTLYKYYQCKYYGQTCWFPTSEIEESGKWS